MKHAQKAIKAILADLEAVKGKLLKLADDIGAKATTGGNPFKPDSLMGVVFAAGSGKFRPLCEILTNAANHPVFMAMKDGNGDPLPMGDMKSKPAGRYKRAYWQYTMLAAEHPSNNGRATCVSPKGQTSKKGHERRVMFVALKPAK